MDRVATDGVARRTIALDIDPVASIAANDVVFTYDVVLGPACNYHAVFRKIQDLQPSDDVIVGRDDKATGSSGQATAV